MLDNMLVGNRVRVLAPFNEFFTDQYEITDIIIHEDGQIACILVEMGGFDPIFLEAV